VSGYVLAWRKLSSFAISVPEGTPSALKDANKGHVSLLFVSDV